MDGEPRGGSAAARHKIWFPLFWSIKKKTGASRFCSLSLSPSFLVAACVADSCEECNGHFAEGAMWTPAGWYLMLAHSGLSERGSPEGSGPAPLALKGPSNYT